MKLKKNGIYIMRRVNKNIILSLSETILVKEVTDETFSATCIDNHIFSSIETGWQLPHEDIGLYWSAEYVGQKEEHPEYFL